MIYKFSIEPVLINTQYVDDSVVRHTRTCLFDQSIKDRERCRDVSAFYSSERRTPIEVSEKRQRGREHYELIQEEITGYGEGSIGTAGTR